MFSLNGLLHIVLNSGMSPSDISKKSGVSHTTLSRIINGQRNDIKLNTAFKLADALGVDVNEFRERDVSE